MAQAGTGATVAAVSPTVPYLEGINYPESSVVLTDAATVAWAAAGGITNDASLLTTAAIGNSRTMGAPTGLVAGGVYTLRVKQDATGSRTVTWNAVFKWVGGSAPTLSTGANKVDQVMFVSDGTNLYEIARALDVR